MWMSMGSVIDLKNTNIIYESDSEIELGRPNQKDPDNGPVVDEVNATRPDEEIVQSVVEIDPPTADEAVTHDPEVQQDPNDPPYYHWNKYHTIKFLLELGDKC